MRIMLNDPTGWPRLKVLGTTRKPRTKEGRFLEVRASINAPLLRRFQTQGSILNRSARGVFENNCCMLFCIRGFVGIPCCLSDRIGSDVCRESRDSLVAIYSSNVETKGSRQHAGRTGLCSFPPDRTSTPSSQARHIIHHRFVLPRNAQTTSARRHHTYPTRLNQKASTKAPSNQSVFYMQSRFGASCNLNLNLNQPHSARC